MGEGAAHAGSHDQGLLALVLALPFGLPGSLGLWIALILLRSQRVLPEGLVACGGGVGADVIGP